MATPSLLGYRHYTYSLLCTRTVEKDMISTAWFCIVVNKYTQYLLNDVKCCELCLLNCSFDLSSLRLFQTWNTCQRWMWPKVWSSSAFLPCLQSHAALYNNGEHLYGKCPHCFVGSEVWEQDYQLVQHDLNNSSYNEVCMFLMFNSTYKAAGPAADFFSEFCWCGGKLVSLPPITYCCWYACDQY